MIFKSPYPSFSAAALLMSGAGWFCWGERVCPGHWRVSGGISNLCPLDANSASPYSPVWLPNTAPDIAECLRRAKAQLVEIDSPKLNSIMTIPLPVTVSSILYTFRQTAQSPSRGFLKCLVGIIQFCFSLIKDIYQFVHIVCTHT